MKNLYFKMSELIHSDIAELYKISNIPEKEHMDNLLNLIWYVLQPLREILGVPVIVTGGYRSLGLWQKLKAIGKNPAKNSQHLNGQAADIQVPKKDLKEVFRIIKTKLPYDQLLYEYDMQGNRWIHVSYNHNNNRHQSIENYKSF